VAIVFHADDFGITPEQSGRILDCREHGILNSLSVIVTSPRLDECLPLLETRGEGLLVGLHANVVEGRCLSDPADVPLLVDEQGVFRQSFASMLRLSQGRSHDELAAQLERELSAQISLFAERVPQARDHLRVDGHQHFQLIPAVFEALLAAIQSSGCHLDYLRVPAEPTSPFLTSGVMGGVEPLNWVKHGLLDWLWGIDSARLPSYRSVSALFCGICFSGHMDAERVSRVFPAFMRLARREEMDVEFLFHPGRVADRASCLNPGLEGFVEFSTGEGRDVERAALMSLRLGHDGSGSPVLVAPSSEA
jgi:hypothetical protein